MKGKRVFMAGVVGMLSGVASGATDGSDVGYEREWNPYVTLRGGWLFGGKMKSEDHYYGRQAGAGADEQAYGSRKKDLKSAWSGSVEFGGSFCEDFVSVGLELGYFTGKAKYEMSETERRARRIGGTAYMDGLVGTYCTADGKYKNLFAAVNVTLRKDIGERAFLYGGAGLGTAKSDFGEVAWRYNYIPDNRGVNDKIDFKSKWRFLTQAFAGIGMHLNENWSLGIGYRLRYLPGNCTGSKKFVDVPTAGWAAWDWKMKQNVIHAAEIGLTYQF